MYNKIISMKNNSVIKSCLIILSFFFIIGCTSEGDKYIGKWQSSNKKVTLDISKIDKIYYLVKVEHNYEFSKCSMVLSDLVNTTATYDYNGVDAFFVKDIGTFTLNESKDEIIPINSEIRNCCTEFIRIDESIILEPIKEVIVEPKIILYQCPMKCEGDKTYNKSGQCPTCKMKLSKINLKGG